MASKRRLERTSLPLWTAFLTKYSFRGIWALKSGRSDDAQQSTRIEGMALLRGKQLRRRPSCFWAELSWLSGPVTSKDAAEWIQQRRAFQAATKRCFPG